MARTRQEICALASKKVGSASKNLHQSNAVVGLDGFVDAIIAVVDKRYDYERFDAVATIGDLGAKITRAAGASSNYELVVKQLKLGGNGPIMANALATAGLAITYIGALGESVIHPVFKELQDRATVYSVCEAGHTDALEFNDGKIMLGKYTQLSDMNWRNLVKCVGLEKLIQIFDKSQLIAMANWTMLPFMSEIWTNLQKEVFPKLSGSKRFMFVDLADPEKRTAADILAALELLKGFQKQVDVTLGLNLKESGEIAEVLKIHVPDDAEGAIEQTAAAIRQKLDIACVVIHPRGGAAAAVQGQSARFAGPFVEKPKISTGAGDHFNAGFCVGRVLGLELAECLCCGTATSGYYVRHAQSPTAEQLAQFIAKLPEPQSGK